MHARAMLMAAAIGGSLAFVGPALAAVPNPSARAPQQAPHRTLVRPAVAPRATTAAPTLYVNGMTGSDGGSCTKTLPCRTIQYAIDQAPTTAKISVAAGDYPEQLTVVGKNLVITGAGKTKTTIDPTTLTQADPNVSADAVVDFDGGTADALSGVTVDGTGVTNDPSCPAGVVMYNANGKLSSAGVMVTSTPAASTMCEYGVEAFDANQAGDAYSFTLSAVSVSDYGNTGVFCGDTGESCSITANHVTGYGPNGDIIQDGILVANSASATVLGNTVTGNVYTSPQYTDASQTDDGGIGLGVAATGRLIASKNSLNGNDVALFGQESTGSWTITDNTLSHSTNDTGSTPGSDPIPNGNFVGDGLDLYQVAGAIVDGNTITSNAGRGINLIDTTNSTFSTDANQKGNTISHNGDDGIALTDYSPLNLTGTSSGDTISGNVIDANAGDGIFAGGNDPSGNPEQENNTFSDNTMQGNLRWDALDQSTGSGSDGTANTWTSNTCNTSSPAGICTSIAS